MTIKIMGRVIGFYETTDGRRHEIDALAGDIYLYNDRLIIRKGKPLLRLEESLSYYEASAVDQEGEYLSIIWHIEPDVAEHIKKHPAHEPLICDCRLNWNNPTEIRHGGK